MMRFYQTQHAFYCGVDLHARKMYVTVVDQAGTTREQRNLDAGPEPFLALVRAYREGLVVGCECMFAWYWLADLCRKEGIDFVLGHALYMKAVHGGKTKNDRIDSEKIARLLRGGMFPEAYAYPHEMRATRDLLRRRTHLVRMRSEALAHVENSTSQYNLPAPAKKLCCAANRVGTAERPRARASPNWDATERSRARRFESAGAGARRNFEDARKHEDFVLAEQPRRRKPTAARACRTVWCARAVATDGRSDAGNENLLAATIPRSEPVSRSPHAESL